MKKVELLIPAGNMAALKAAVNNGADAVYFAGKNFGARAYANNFSEEEIIEAIKYCHLFGVKAYITVNTMIYESELNDITRYIEFLYVSGVDALIMQDIGIINMVRERFPNLEIHASTQMHNVNDGCLEYLHDIGVKRAVLARELSLKEINDIKVPIEKEVFIHGALCVSYSGNCLFSSLVGGRSGNRGECAGSCRLPYCLYENDKRIKLDDKYLLSMKELSSLDNMKEILNSNIDSLKVEGRMKSHQYVAFITRLYRTIIDRYYEGKSINVSVDDKKKLATLFNREFTKGFINGEDEINIVNGKSPNHIGIEIGKVIDIKDKIKVLLTEDIYQNDGIRFSSGEGMIVNYLYDKSGKLTSFVKKGEICFFDKKVKAGIKDTVNKTSDSSLNNEIASYEPRKIPVNLKVYAHNNELLTVSYDNITLKGTIVQKSIKRPTTESEIIRSLSKLGNTHFYVKDVNADIGEDVFISVSELNDLRRRCIELLIDDKTNTPLKDNINTLKKKELKVDITKDISFLVRDEETLKYLLNKNINVIYVTDEKLYDKYKNDKRVFLRLRRANTKLCNIKGERLLVSDTGSLNKYVRDNYLVTDAYMNASNCLSLYYMHKLGVKKITLSLELDYDNIRRTIKDYSGKHGHNPNVEVVVYGKPELMIMKYDLLGKYVKENSNNKYYLEDRMGEKYRILKSGDLTYIMHYKDVDLLDDIEYLKSLGVTNFRIDLLDEDKEMVDTILSKLGL